jgi:uncharacterized protein
VSRTFGSPLHWAALGGLSLFFVGGLEWLQLPAALLLGSMAAAVPLAARGTDLSVPPRLFYGAQAVVGCLIARAFPPAIFSELATNWPIFLGGVLSVVAASTALGWLLTRRQVLPGSTAVWGSSPGAATVMTLMSESYGADIRLVAFMQYLRVVVVALVATLIARLWAAPGSHPALPVDWFPHVVWPSLAATIVLIVAGAVAGRALRIPAGPMLVPMVVGTVLQDAGILKIELPPLLLALAYLVVGWSIGLRFSRPILIHAAKAFPRVLASILVLIASCGGLSMMLVALAHVDPLTAYLATSPGGADSVAIIAASTKVNVPFVMAMQIARFVFVLLTGPGIARLIADRAQKRPIGAPIEPAETAR